MTMREDTISVDWGRLRFFLGEVLTNFTRNAGMQFTAIGTVAVTIVLLGAFLYVRETVATFGTGVLSQIEIAVFLKDDVDDAKAKDLAAKLTADPRVASVVYIPRRDGLRRLKDVLGSDFDTSLLTANPLPNAFHVRVRDADLVPAVARSIDHDPRVAKTDYAADTVQKLLKAATVLGRIGLALIILLSLSAAIVIANTIRLTVFARRREIAIMQLVGATNMYIRLPFIAEGMLAGVLGAAVAIAVLALAAYQVVPKVAATLSFVTFHVNALALCLELLAVGAAVGLVASWFSVGRYLRT
jgi:cell division transport system permease protein